MISYETAKRLKQAGFPQPEPAFGQVWYELHDLDVSRYIISSTEDGISGGWKDGGTFEDAPLSSMETDIFAPTAEDILRFALEYSLVRVENGNGEFWAVLNNRAEYFTVDENNAAEAAALAWLQIHEKTGAWLASADV